MAEIENDPDFNPDEQVEAETEPQIVKVNQFVLQIMGLLSEVLRIGGTVYQIADVTVGGETKKVAIVMMSGLTAEALQKTLQAQAQTTESVQAEKIDRMLLNFEGPKN